jgi:PAS domain S-box-containing protein
MTTKRVLVVDDNAENLYLLRALLQGQGYEVDEALQGAEALNKARQNPPDLIVSDILMPVMDGFALCRQWKKDPRLRLIPFIFYTATYIDDRDREFALGLGAEQFIVKPMDPDAFLAIVSDLVRRAGDRPAEQAAPAPGTPPQPPDVGAGDGDIGYLKQYNEALVRKLERRMEQLEQANLAMEKDIAERQRAEAELRSNEEKYRQLFDLESDAIFLIDNETGRLLEANVAATKLYGYSHGELLARKNTDLSAEPEATRAATIGSATVIPLRRHRKKDGTVFPVEITASRFLWNARPVHLAAIRDVTEQMKGAEELRNSEARFRDLFQHMSSGVAVYEAKDDGADFVFKDINEAGLRLDAVKREDVVGRPVTGVFPGIGEMGLLDVFRRVWRTGAAERYPVAQYADARIYRWYENHVYKLASGEIVAVYDDLTAQRNAEEALRESEDKFRHMFDRSVVGMSITALSGGIQVNQAFCNMLGYNPEEIQNRTWQDLTYPEDVEATQKLLDRIRSGATDSARFVKRYIHKNGSVIWADVGTFLRRDRKGDPLYFMTVASDITDRKKAEDELAQQIEELRRWYDVTLGREGRILELKREVNELLANAGRPARYDSADEGNKP